MRGSLSESLAHNKIVLYDMTDGIIAKSSDIYSGSPRTAIKDNKAPALEG